jgi:hypothetical protein
VPKSRLQCYSVSHARPHVDHEHYDTRRMNDGAFPQLVELAVPTNGFRKQGLKMVAFHLERGIQARYGRSRQDEGQFYVTFCFADSGTADEFQRKFGGERLKLATPRDWP